MNAKRMWKSGCAVAEANLSFAIVWASPSTGHAGARNGQIRVENTLFLFFCYLSLARFMFEALFGNILACSWKCVFGRSFAPIKPPRRPR